MTKDAKCTAAGCERFTYARGLCSRHYSRRYKKERDSFVQKPQGVALNWLRNSALVFESNECLIWPFTRDKAGYGTVKFEGRTQKASRVVCVLAHGGPPNVPMEAAHSCGNAACVNPAHIRWATPKENQFDRVLHGTSNRGKRGKLSEDDVRVIRSLASTMKQQEIADMYGMHQSSISYIVNGKKTWLWLDEEEKVGS